MPPTKGERGRLQPSPALTPSRLPNKTRARLPASVRALALAVVILIGLGSASSKAFAADGSGLSVRGQSSSRWGSRSWPWVPATSGTSFSGSELSSPSLAGSGNVMSGRLPLDIGAGADSTPSPDTSENPTAGATPTGSATADSNEGSPGGDPTANDSESAPADAGTATATDTATATVTATATATATATVTATAEPTQGSADDEAAAEEHEFRNVMVLIGGLLLLLAGIHVVGSWGRRG